MNNEKMTETQNMEDVSENKKGLIEWIKEHKLELIFAGVGITALIATVFGLQNKEAITELGVALKKEIKKGSLYSEKWFRNANLEELQDARAIIQQDYLNPELDIDYRSGCLDLLHKFDTVISNKKWAGREYGYPVQSENGWHLPSND